MNSLSGLNVSYGGPTDALSLSESALYQMQLAAKSTLNSTTDPDEKTRSRLQAIVDGKVPVGIKIRKNKDEE